MASVKKRRLDDELVEQGYFPDRATAMRAVMAGEVSSSGERLTRPAMLCDEGIPLHVRTSRRASAQGHGVYVSRGALKLEGALSAFHLDVMSKNCLDIGASTGGFTDCLLRCGAAHVSAVDVGYGQFDWGLRSDSRVSLFERTNICTADPAAIGAPFDLVVADVSFTSIGTILPAVILMLDPKGQFCCLVKPQFEAPRGDVGRGGVVRDPAVHRQVLRQVITTLAAQSLQVQALCVSPLHGAKGNIEYFVLSGPSSVALPVDIDAVVDEAWSDTIPVPYGSANGGNDR